MSIEQPTYEQLLAERSHLQRRMAGGHYEHDPAGVLALVG
jgi:hypothetical protein